MMQGPRIYNAMSDEERVARLLKKQARKTHEVHRVRRNRIVAIFALAFLLLGIQVAMKLVQARNIRTQVKASETQLAQVNRKNSNLKAEVQDLSDSDYLAKLVRDKYYYSKPGETVYIMPGKVSEP